MKHRHAVTITVSAKTKRELALLLLEAIEGLAKSLPDAVDETWRPAIDRSADGPTMTLHVAYEDREQN